MCTLGANYDLILNEAEKKGYQIKLSHELEDREWDKFIERREGGHHTQTSLWSQLKSISGFEVIRITISYKGETVAGGQILTKSFPCLGSIGYLPKGPVFVNEDQILAELIETSIFKIIKECHIKCLVVQPPDNGNAIESILSSSGFQLSSIELAPTASVVIDLTKDLDEISCKFNRRLRYNIRYSQRKGITIREGTSHDLSTFYGLLCKTAKRKNFRPELEDYYRNLWRIFGSRGYCKLFFAEYRGEVISGILLLTFSDTVYYKRGCWSGQYPNLKPNDSLQWTVIRWAKGEGYKYYDFEGIDRNIAATVLSGGTIAEDAKASVSGFKLNLGAVRFSFRKHTAILAIPYCHGFMLRSIRNLRALLLPTLSEIKLLPYKENSCTIK